MKNKSVPGWLSLNFLTLGILQFDAFPNFRALMLHGSQNWTLIRRGPSGNPPLGQPLQPNPTQRQQSDPARLGPLPGGEAGRGPSSPKPVLRGPAPSGKHRRPGGRLYKSWFLVLHSSHLPQFKFRDYRFQLIAEPVQNVNKSFLAW